MCTFGASQVVLVIKNPPANAGHVRDTGSIPGLGRSPGGGHGNRLQYSCLENAKDRETCRATVHSFAQSWTQLKQLSTHAHVYLYVEGDQIHGVRMQKTKQNRATNNSIPRQKLWALEDAIKARGLETTHVSQRAKEGLARVNYILS